MRTGLGITSKVFIDRLHDVSFLINDVNPFKPAFATVKVGKQEICKGEGNEELNMKLFLNSK
jgi:hypothetical protein